MSGKLTFGEPMKVTYTLVNGKTRQKAHYTTHGAMVRALRALKAKQPKVVYHLDITYPNGRTMRVRDAYIPVNKPVGYQLF